MNDLELISNVLCPYTQRAAIQLAEKDVPFERVYVDLADKPDWFAQLSPLGKVPVLRTREGAVFETSVICEYIEDAFPGALHPQSPFERARHRAWIEFASSMIADVYMFYTAPTQEAFAKKAADLRAKMGRLDAALEAAPYFSGDTFRLVDAAFAPIFRLFDTFDRVGDFGVFEGCGRVRAYREALMRRDSVRDVVVADYGRQFEDYLRGQGSHLSSLMEVKAA